MPDDNDLNADEIAAAAAAKEAEGVEGVESEGDDPDGAEKLGDPGKKALNTMKTERNTLRQEVRKKDGEIADLKAQLESVGKTPDEQAAEKIRREAATEATSKANQRILRAEIRAAAAGKLANPAAAVRFLDLDSFEVDDNGDVDADAINDAIAQLLVDEPYLAATRDGFPKNDTGSTTRGNEKPAAADPDTWLRGRLRGQ